ncbi:MAG: SusC/RagA family TonB-linked outer membrane protein, partial [Sediminibacterium sp.]|nr:SusC/RagA family TonB-linked outer membrane protein [Sediminibacterium sp.]
MRKSFLMVVCAFLFALSGFAQTTSVTGKVVDEKGAPVSGASVLERGTKNGANTANDGSFSLKVKPGATLVISGLGFETKQMVASSGNLMIELTPDVKSLNEVVVTGFGGNLIKKDVTGNIARVKGKDFEFQPTPSVDAALQGKAAGVFVNSQSGKLGQAVTVRVRGNSSISANSQPLY